MRLFGFPGKTASLGRIDRAAPPLGVRPRALRGRGALTSSPRPMTRVISILGGRAEVKRRQGGVVSDGAPGYEQGHATTLADAQESRRGNPRLFGDPAMAWHLHLRNDLRRAPDGPVAVLCDFGRRGRRSRRDHPDLRHPVMTLQSPIVRTIGSPLLLQRVCSGARLWVAVHPPPDPSPQ